MSLNIVIDADVQTATAKIGKFVYTFKESFKEVETTVKRTSQKVKQDTDQISDSVNSFGKSSRNSLTALSLTIQDLPFGFIGIQNNLPGIIQGFGQMSAEAKTGASVMSQLKGALVGPAGLFLAFSIVTAGVTALVQKYGSLGEGIKALFGILPKVTETQKRFNEAIADASGSAAVEEAKIKILVKTLSDLNQPLQTRLDSYSELKRIQPDVVAGLRDENALTTEGIQLINDNANARLELLKLKVKEAGITAVLTKNAEEQAIATQQLNVASAKYVKDADAYIKSLNNQNVSGQALVLLQKNAYDEFIASGNSVSELLKKQKELTKVSEDYVKQLEPILLNISAINTQTQERIDNLKKQDQLEKKLTKTLDKQRKEGWQGIIEALKEYDKFVQLNKEANQRAIEFNVDLQFKKIAEATKKATIEQGKYRKGMEGIISALQQRDSLQMKDPFSFDFSKFKKGFKKAQFETVFYELKETLMNVFFNPLQDAFVNLFETGKFNLKSFGDAFLMEIKKLVAKVLATGIVSLLANLATGGFSGEGGAAAGFARVLKDVIGSFGGKQEMNPSFVGIGGGSLGMSGQVTVVLRGQDLVGAINRTNTTINRVG